MSKNCNTSYPIISMMKQYKGFFVEIISWAIFDKIDHCAVCPRSILLVLPPILKIKEQFSRLDCGNARLLDCIFLDFFIILNEVSHFRL